VPASTEELLKGAATAAMNQNKKTRTERGTVMNSPVATEGDRFVAAAIDIVDCAIETQTSDGSFSCADPKPWRHGANSHRVQREPVTVGHDALSFHERTEGKIPRNRDITVRVPLRDAPADRRQRCRVLDGTSRTVGGPGIRDMPIRL
jgi:hypothetical protein